MQKYLDEQVEKWLASGVAVDAPVGCNWNSPLLCIKQRYHTGEGWKFRICIDPRHINDSSEHDKYPIPIITDVFEKLMDTEEASELDLKQGYNQFGILPSPGKTVTSCSLERPLASSNSPAFSNE
jgi:hypothetical protein